MTGLIIFLILIVVVILGAAAAKNKKLTSSGVIAQRDMGFWESAELFFTGCTFEEFTKAIRASEPLLTQYKVALEYHPEEEIVTFKAKGAWNALIESLGESEGKQNLRFSFAAWNQRNGMPNGMLSMNVTLTAVEKAILSVDPKTTVETRKLKLKTK